MRASTIFLALSRFLLPPAIIATLLLYLYPAAQQCGFPTIPPSKSDGVQETQCFFNSSSSSSSRQEGGGGGTAATLGRIRREKAPFRLLALGDPQLEGDTSLAKYRRGSGNSDGDGTFPSLSSLRTHFASTLSSDTNTTLSDLGALATESLKGLLKQDVPRLLATWRKKLDLLGNDYYLAHIFRLVRWWTQPTHVVVLGDLLGSQWIGDEEFERRADRFWGTVFKGVDRVEDEIMSSAAHGEMEGEEGGAGREVVDVVDSPEWREWQKRLINVAGNHDIGYAGDINTRRIARFERRFGRVNWSVRFRLPSPHNDTLISKTPNNQTNPLFSQSQQQQQQPPPELELVILNDMNLDLPALSLDLHNQSWSFLEDVIDSKRRRQEEQQSNTSATTTILLTHIPLHKNAGVCVDAPFFSYFPETNGGGIREQNHLSSSSSRRILNGLFGDDDGDSGGGGGIILNGHDHEGCDVWHYKESDEPLLANEEETEEGGHGSRDKWTAIPFSPSSSSSSSRQENKGVREITVRSMMGSYSGTAGLLSGYFDPVTASWQFQYSTCVLGVQHIWWAVHVLDLVVVGLGVLGVVVEGLGGRGRGGEEEEEGKEREERGVEGDEREKEEEEDKKKKS